MPERSWEIWNSEKVEYLVKKWGYPIKEYQRAHILMSKGAELCVGKSVLDVGCGLGHLKHYLPKDVEYMGVDSSKAILKKARELGPDINFSYGDIYDLSKFGKYDTVMALSLIIHIPDFKEALEELCAHASKVMVFSIFIQDQDYITVYNKGTIRRIMSQKTIDRVFRKLGIVIFEEFGFEDPTLDYTKILRVWV